MKYKAEYKGAVRSADGNYLEMMFEYRGKSYFVTRPLSWTNCSSDYTVFKGHTERKQHEEQQRLIDNSIDNPFKRDLEKEKKAQKELDDAINMMFDYLE
jgi:hypothetical protein